MGCSLPGSSVHGIFRQEYWSRLPFPSPGHLPDAGIEPKSPSLQADRSFPGWATREACKHWSSWRKSNNLECISACCVSVSVSVLLSQSCPTFHIPVDCSPPGSSVHGILQARIVECVATSSSRGSSRPRDQTLVSCVSCIVGRFFSGEPSGKPPLEHTQL